MKIMKQLQIRIALILAVLIITVLKMTGQTAMPDVFLKGPLKEQLNFLDEHTKIYDNYRAIREDMFQKVKGNVSDTLAAVHSKIAELNKTASALNQTIISYKTNLDSTKTSLEEMTKTKNSNIKASLTSPRKR